MTQTLLHFVRRLLYTLCSFRYSSRVYSYEMLLLIYGVVLNGLAFFWVCCFYDIHYSSISYAFVWIVWRLLGLCSVVVAVVMMGVWYFGCHYCMSMVSFLHSNQWIYPSAPQQHFIELKAINVKLFYNLPLRLIWYFFFRIAILCCGIFPYCWSL